MKLTRQLNEEETKQYVIVTTNGNYDDMFDWAYTLGQQHQLEYTKHEMEKFQDGFGHPKDCELCRVYREYEEENSLYQGKK